LSRTPDIRASMRSAGKGVTRVCYEGWARLKRARRAKAMRGQAAGRLLSAL